ncbi:class I SAM-dependent methyltransferase [Candidatus Woesearchaeota archaeon]|nr:class I SAM-dependent methyltransferase [Candidatus Woesearchaeota archaeon]
MEHYFSEKQSSKLSPSKIQEKIKNIKLEFCTAKGVFSKRRIDLGTRILIENCIIKPNWKILDLGCGIGAIGISIKKLYPETKVTMADINERAVTLAKRNIKLNDVEAIKIIKSDLYKNINQTFDCILSNPPLAAGRAICYGIIELAPKFLNRNGCLQIVARHKKGGAELEKKMIAVFGNAKQIAKKSGYRVYLSIIK